MGDEIRVAILTANRAIFKEQLFISDILNIFKTFPNLWLYVAYHFSIHAEFSDLI